MAKMPLFAASETSSFPSELFTFFVIKGWMCVRHSGFNPSGCCVHCVVPLFSECLLPLIGRGACLLPLVVEFGFDPHILRVMFDCPLFPVVKGSWVVEFGHVDSQRCRESIDEHVDYCLIVQVVPSKVGKPFEGADIIIEPVVSLHFKGFDISLGVHFSSYICERPKKGVRDRGPQVFMVVVSRGLGYVVHCPT